MKTFREKLTQIIAKSSIYDQVDEICKLADEGVIGKDELGNISFSLPRDQLRAEQRNKLYEK